MGNDAARVDQFAEGAAVAEKDQGDRRVWEFAQSGKQLAGFSHSFGSVSLAERSVANWSSK